MVNHTTKNFLQINDCPSNATKFFDIKTNNGEKCVVVFNRTRTQTKLFFIAYTTNQPEENSTLSEGVLNIKSLLKRYDPTKIYDGVVFVHSCKYSAGVAYRKKTKNIEKVINDGIYVAVSQLQQLCH